LNSVGDSIYACLRIRVHDRRGNPVTSCPELVVMQASNFRLWKITIPWKALLVLLAAEPVLVVIFYSVERYRLRAIEKNVVYGDNSNSTINFWKFEMPGLRNPRALSAEASKIPDSDEVIGVVVNGRPRAYWLKALKYPPWHIVNDVIVGVPVSVTYCDRTDCTRVYTNGQSSIPLDVNLGGLYGRQMVVKVAGSLYLQDSGKPFELGAGTPSLPYTIHPWMRTTWKEWKQRHPETDVFVGLGRPGPRP
jgi:Protein of unknown function (DUF3179)